MCGFAGVLNLNGLNGSPEQRQRNLRAMGQQLARRGPDDEQLYDDGTLSLVFRRLSIVDLDGGRQPLWNEDHSILCTVNGEIYNHREIRQRLKDRHRFASNSDSEVVVHLYEDHDEHLMESLNGMFGLLVWDTRRKNLLLARDRLGIKPLFYAQVGDLLLFGSEMKALLAHPDCPRELNWHDFEHGSKGMLSNPTYVAGIHTLPGGHYLHVTGSGSTQPRAYWNIRDHFPSADDPGTRSEQDWIEACGELLQDSVHKRLMSDVPVGIFLSGGIDSSLIAGMAANAGQELRCFTVVEDNTLAAGDVEQAKRVSAELGMDYYPVRYDATTVLEELEFDLHSFEFIVWGLERPRFAMEWLLKHELHRYAKSHMPALKVILLGQGADEFAGGYSHSLGNSSGNWEEYMRRLRGEHTRSRRAEAGIPVYMDAALAEDYPPIRQDPELADYHRHMIKRTAALQRYNLWHEDRTSSCQGIESRVPFLDHRLVELLASIPAALHPSLFYDKRIFREQFARVLPSYPADKRKVRFYLTGQGDSIRRMRVDIIRRIFPDFRSKYLDRPDSIFSGARMAQACHDIISGKPVSDDDLDDFFDALAISVFEHQISTMHTAGPPAGIDPPSPLSAWQG